MTAEGWSFVSEANPYDNHIVAAGPLPPSSEALTHAMFYRLDSDIGGVIHVHSLPMWNRYRGRIPTSSPDIRYGTPEMSLEVSRLWRESSLRDSKRMVMGGHKEGVITFGNDLEEAGAILAEMKRGLV